MDKLTPEMIGQVITVTITGEKPKTVTRMIGRIQREEEVPGETEPTTNSATGRLSRYANTDADSYLWFEGFQEGPSLRWVTDSFTVNVEVYG